jgi:putative oxidoreductase
MSGSHSVVSVHNHKKTLGVSLGSAVNGSQPEPYARYMERLLGRYSSHIYALLRIAAGFLFFQHGLPKLFGGFGRTAPVELMSQMGLAGIIEVVGGVLIAIGLFTSPVAFIASGEMAVAYFQAHAPRGFWPITNGGELAALYCFVFLYFAAVGSGKWSVDSLRK